MLLSDFLKKPKKQASRQQRKQAPRPQAAPRQQKERPPLLSMLLGQRPVEQLVGDAPAPTQAFWSAVDYPGEMEALLEARMPFGVAVKRMSSATFQRLLTLLKSHRAKVPLFVDSGAYSESRESPFTDADWTRALDRYVEIAKVAGPRAFFVAPDEIGSFEGTEKRLEATGGRLRELLDYGSHILVAVQPGPGSLIEREARLMRAAGLTKQDNAHPALPWTRKVPVKPSMQELADFLRHRKPRYVHFLGLGEKNRDWDWDRLARIVAKASPDTTMSGDSNRFGAMRGYGEGTSRVRPLTRAADIADLSGGRFAPFAQEYDLVDEQGMPLGQSTENWVNVAAWTTANDRREIARRALLPQDMAAVFIENPDDFVEQFDLLDAPFLLDEVDNAWAARAQRMLGGRLSGDRRRFLATREVLKPAPTPQQLGRMFQRDMGVSMQDERAVAWLRRNGVERVRSQEDRRYVADLLEDAVLRGKRI